jgi:hypothetical protein
MSRSVPVILRSEATKNLTLGIDRSRSFAPLRMTGKEESGLTVGKKDKVR